MLQKALGDFAVTYELNVYCDDPSTMIRLYTKLHRSILDVFNQIAVDRKKYVYYPGTQMVPTNAAPRLTNVAHSVPVHASVPKGGAEGVLMSMGGNDGGFAFYVQDGKLTYGYNYVADQRFKERLLTHSQQALLRSIQIGNEDGDCRERQTQRQHRDDAASSGEASKRK